MSNIKWNNQVKLILSDVDETVADLYIEATAEMIEELTSLLKEEKILFFITGQGLGGVRSRITDKIPNNLRKNILIGHCSGAEVWGFKLNGDLQDKPIYSVYNLTQEQKIKWRDLIKQLVNEFKLRTFPSMPIRQFIQRIGEDPLDIILEDRGPQITFEIVNGYDLTVEQVKKLEIEIPQTHGNYDLRIPILERAEQLFIENDLPITPRLGGIFAIDFALKGVSKTTAVKHALGDDAVLRSLNLSKKELENPSFMEVWGDKFSVIRGGTDRHISEALPKEVRSIDFRIEDSREFLEGFNIVVWDGHKNLQEGLLEYLKNRPHGKI